VDHTPVRFSRILVRRPRDRELTQLRDCVLDEVDGRAYTFSRSTLPSPKAAEIDVKGFATCESAEGRGQRAVRSWNPFGWSAPPMLARDTSRSPAPAVEHNARRSSPGSNSLDAFHGPEALCLSGPSFVKE